MNSLENERRWWPKAYFLLILAYLLFPLVIVVPLSFGDDSLMQFPPTSWGLRWYTTYFSDSVWIAATLLSLKVALMASALATVVGTLAVIALERQLIPGKVALQGLISSPMIVPHIFIALGVFILAIHVGIENSVLTLAGAHATIALPFVVLMVGAAMRQVDPTLERAARILGAKPFRAFFSATFPSLLPAIVAAAVFSFFVSFDELIIAEFLMSGRETLPMRIWADLKLDLNPTISAVSTLLIVVTVIGMGGAEILRRRGNTFADNNAKG